MAGRPRIDAELTGFNTPLRHRPAVVVGATEPADVAAPVRYASRRELAVGVHGTGHGSVSARQRSS